jgi:predicted RNase H-like nuclease (RuvC/YqgF family)
MTEDLKSQLDYFKDEPKYLRKVIDELEQENERLKDELNKTIKEYNYFNKACVEANTKNIELQRENKELEENQCHFSTCEHIDAEIARYAKLSESFLNYRSALEKIKNILNETLETHRITVALARIRDIIDEVLND